MKNILITKQITTIIILICIIVILVIFAFPHKPPVAQFEDDFGFSLGDLSIKTIDYYHHDDFRDSLTIYRISVDGSTAGSIFDTDTMYDGLPEKAEGMLKDAAERTKGNSDFGDLSSIDPAGCRSTVLSDIKGTDACLCIINYGKDDEFLLIWVG